MKKSIVLNWEYRWTRDKPTKPGWYWVKRTDGNQKPQVMKFVCVEKAFRTADNYPVEPEIGPLSTAGWEWFAGPINLPIEPEEFAKLP